MRVLLRARKNVNAGLSGGSSCRWAAFRTGSGGRGARGRSLLFASGPGLCGSIRNADLSPQRGVKVRPLDYLPVDSGILVSVVMSCHDAT